MEHEFGTIPQYWYSNIPTNNRGTEGFQGRMTPGLLALSGGLNFSSERSSN